MLTCLKPPEEKGGARSARPHTHLEPGFALTLLTGIALTRHQAAIDTLTALIASESALADASLEALATASFGRDVTDRLAGIVDNLDSPRITRLYRKYFPA